MSCSTACPSFDLLGRIILCRMGSFSLPRLCRGSGQSMTGLCSCLVPSLTSDKVSFPVKNHSGINGTMVRLCHFCLDITDFCNSAITQYFNHPALIHLLTFLSTEPLHPQLSQLDRHMKYNHLLPNFVFNLSYCS